MCGQRNRCSICWKSIFRRIRDRSCSIGSRGTLAKLVAALRWGCYFSVNERMLASPNGRRILREIPEDRLLTETDGPFVERHGKPIPAGDVLRAVEEIAVVKGRSVSDVQSLIVENLRNLTMRSVENQ